MNMIDKDQYVFLAVDEKDLPDRMALLRQLGHDPYCTVTGQDTKWHKSTFWIRMPVGQYDRPYFMTKAYRVTDHGQLPGWAYDQAAWSREIEVPNLKALKGTHTLDRDFLIFPQDANHTQLVVFGGKLLAEMDLTAAILIKKILKSEKSPAVDAVTHKLLNTEFMLPSYVGDLVTSTARIMGCGIKTFTVHVTVSRDQDLIAKSDFVFVTTGPLDPQELAEKPKYLKYIEHGLYV